MSPLDKTLRHNITLSIDYMLFNLSETLSLRGFVAKKILLRADSIYKNARKMR
jgi:hypothetical protein